MRTERDEIAAIVARAYGGSLYPGLGVPGDYPVDDVDYRAADAIMDRPAITRSAATTSSPPAQHLEAPMQSERERVLRLLEERAAGYGALRQSSTTAIAMDRAAALIRAAPAVVDPAPYTNTVVSHETGIGVTQVADRQAIARIVIDPQYRTALEVADAILALRPADQLRMAAVSEQLRDGESQAVLPIPPEGWVCVPREPTEAMIAQALAECDRNGYAVSRGMVDERDISTAYAAMLSAAPALDRKGAAS